MDFNRYFNNNELQELIAEWCETYPTLIQQVEIGRSYEDRPIVLLRLTNQETGAACSKPAMWIDANLHSTEIAGTTAALHAAYTLLSEFGTDEHCTRVMNTAALYLIPRVNPDGAELAMAEKPKFIRSGSRAYPYPDEDEGLHEEDIDGDGRILQMRISDPHGNWKKSSVDPRMMVLRGSDEHGGDYYRILPEGRIKDFDGYTIRMARRQQGLDFNRNFPFEWRPENDQEGAGPYPTSEPEVRSYVEAIMERRNINIALCHHTYSGVLLRPYGTKDDSEMETEDLWVYEELGERGEELTGYKCLSVFHDFKYHPKKVITGTSDDWIYDHLGAYAFVVEIWNLLQQAGIEDYDFMTWWRKHPETDDIKILRWLDENSDGGYVDWYEFDHPQLGKIELGGFNRMYSLRNPPHAFMQAEAEKLTRYTIALMSMLPRLETHEVSVQALSEDRYVLKLILDNTGYLPTYTSEQAKNRKAVRPIRALLDLPEGVGLLVGKQQEELGHLKGRSHHFANPIYAGSPTENRLIHEWVLTGEKGSILTLSILSDRAGSLKEEIVLE